MYLFIFVDNISMHSWRFKTDPTGGMIEFAPIQRQSYVWLTDLKTFSNFSVIQNCIISGRKGEQLTNKIE